MKTVPTPTNVRRFFRYSRAAARRIWPPPRECRIRQRVGQAATESATLRRSRLATTSPIKAKNGTGWINPDARRTRAPQRRKRSSSRSGRATAPPGARQAACTDSSDQLMGCVHSPPRSAFAPHRPVVDTGLLLAPTALEVQPGKPRVRRNRCVWDHDRLQREPLRRAPVSSQPNTAVHPCRGRAGSGRNLRVRPSLCTPRDASRP